MSVFSVAAQEKHTVFFWIWFLSNCATSKKPKGLWDLEEECCITWKYTSKVQVPGICTCVNILSYIPPVEKRSRKRNTETRGDVLSWHHHRACVSVDMYYWIINAVMSDEHYWWVTSSLSVSVTVPRIGEWAWLLLDVGVVSSAEYEIGMLWIIKRCWVWYWSEVALFIICWSSLRTELQ